MLFHKKLITVGVILALIGTLGSPYTFILGCLMIVIGYIEYKENKKKIDVKKNDETKTIQALFNWRRC